MSSDDVQTNLRLPSDLKDRLVAAAGENNRSLSAEVSHRLSSGFEQDETVKLLRGNMVLLRAMADFIALRHGHPEVMAPMEAAMVNVAKAIKSIENDGDLRKATREPFADYVMGLANALNQATDAAVRTARAKKHLENSLSNEVETLDESGVGDRSAPKPLATGRSEPDPVPNKPVPKLVRRQRPSLKK